MADEADFMNGLRELKSWSGLSFRQLERRAAKVGASLPASTAATMLGKNRLPREELLETFVRACGLEEDAVAQWVAVRGQLAEGPQEVRRPPRWRLAVAAGALVLAFLGGGAVFSSGDATAEQESVATHP